MRPRYFGTAALSLAIVTTPTFLAAQADNDIEQGRSLFQGMCVTCHGFEGGGGDAPSLNRPVLDRAPDDAALRALIGDGLPDRGMPRVRRLTSNELRQLVAYVRSLGRTPSARIAGNPDAGASIYRKAGCMSCHVIKGEGGILGPELTDIGRLRGAQYLRTAVVDPNAALPRGTLPIPARGFSEFLPVSAVTRDGREIHGVRLNEDVFTIQLRDASNIVYSLRKSDLKGIQKEGVPSLMPSVAGRLTSGEIDDLVAYLSTLRGAK